MSSPSAALAATAVPCIPATISYIPSFISVREESSLLSSILSQPKPKWTVLTHRRLQTHPSALSSSNTLLSAPLPPFLEALVPRMQALGVWDDAPHNRPNHVLINEYGPGEGIMPHEDGTAYHPVVATVSLGAPIVLDIYEKGERVPKFRILQEPRRRVLSNSRWARRRGADRGQLAGYDGWGVHHSPPWDRSADERRRPTARDDCELGPAGRAARVRRGTVRTTDEDEFDV